MLDQMIYIYGESVYEREKLLPEARDYSMKITGQEKAISSLVVGREADEAPKTIQKIALTVALSFQ